MRRNSCGTTRRGGNDESPPLDRALSDRDRFRDNDGRCGVSAMTDPSDKIKKAEYVNHRNDGDRLYDHADICPGAPDCMHDDDSEEE